MSKRNKVNRHWLNQPTETKTTEEGFVKAVDLIPGLCYHLVLDQPRTRPQGYRWPSQMKLNPQRPYVGPFLVLKEVSLGRFSILQADGSLSTIIFSKEALFDPVVLR